MAKKKHKLRSRVEELNLALAKKYLATSKRNRPISEKTVAEYKQSLLAGTWGLISHGIAFNTRGELIDGHHRLLAIIAAAIVNPAIVVEIYVTRGVDPANVKYYDMNKRRTECDAINIEGGNATNRSVAIARRVMSSRLPSMGVTFTRDEVMAFEAKHHDALTFTTSVRPPARMSNVSIYAVVMRAYYTCDRARLREFMEYFFSGQVQNADTDGAVIALRNYMISLRGRRGRETSVEIYDRTETALTAFLQRRPLKLVKSASREMFLLPGETPSAIFNGADTPLRQPTETPVTAEAQPQATDATIVTADAPSITESPLKFPNLHRLIHGANQDDAEAPLSRRVRRKASARAKVAAVRALAAETYAIAGE